MDAMLQDQKGLQISNGKAQLWLIRHGETAWSLSGAHTGRTDLELTPAGRQNAETVGRYLHEKERKQFSVVLSSPLRRAIDTCRLAGYGAQAQLDDNLKEWDYGAYEGRSTPEIRRERPDWNLWKDGPLDGESAADVYARAGKVIERVAGSEGDVAIFAHGHLLRILTSCWLSLQPTDGRLFALSTGTISVLGYERETRVISRWNQPVE